MHIKWVRKIIQVLSSTKTQKAIAFLNDIKEFKK